MALLAASAAASPAQNVLPVPASSAPLSIRAAKSLALQESANRSVVLRGVVTAFSGWKNSFFLQDSTGGISVDRLEQTALSVGDAVAVHGTLTPGLFAPLVISQSIDVTGQAKLPAPSEPSFEELDDGGYDGLRVQVTGVVHSAEITRIWGRRILLMSLHVPGGLMSVHVLNSSELAPSSLVDSTLTLRGVCGTKFNDRRQIIGLRLFVPGAADIQVNTPAIALRAIPVSKIVNIRQYPSGILGHHRVHVQGVVTYQTPEHGLYMEEDGGAIHVQTPQQEGLRPGQRVEAWGFVQNYGYSPGLTDAIVQALGQGKELPPKRVNAGEVFKSLEGFQTTHYDGQFVEMEATVVEQLPSRRDQLWLLRHDNVLFQAELSGESSWNAVAFEPQSKIRVVGICVAEVGDNGDPTSFRLLLRSDRDITVARSPHWEKSFFFLLAGFVAMLLTALAVWTFDRIYAAPVSLAARLRGKDGGHTKLKKASAVLCWLVLGCALILLLVSASSALLPDGWPGSKASWLVMAAASAGALWSGAEERGRKWISQFCSAAALASGAVALWRYRTPLSSAVQAADFLNANNGPGVTVAVALCFCVLGVSLLLLRYRRFVYLAQLSAIAAATLAGLNIVTRSYSASPSYAVARHVTMPPLTGICFLLLSMAVLLAKPGAGVMGPVFSPSFGGMISRRLLPAALSIPLILGWFHLQGQRVGLYDSPFGLALFALANSFAFACMVWTSSAVLNRLDQTRLEVEGKLSQRDAQFELLFEKTGIGDYTWDIVNDRITAHPVIWQLYGYPPNRTVGSGEDFRRRQHPEDAKAIAQAVEAALQTRSSLETEFRIVLPDGSTRWISCRANVICDEAGKPAFVNGLNIDVTERKRSEAELLESMTRARAIARQFQMGLEFSKVASWRWLLEQDELTWNGPVKEIFGVDPNQLPSYASVRTLIDARDVAQLEASISVCREEGTNFVTEFRFNSPSGVRWIAGRGGALRDDAGQIYGLSGVNLDVTAAKAAEQRLLESERNFRELADAMPQIVYIADNEGKMEYTNQRWFEYSGSAADQDWASFIHPDDMRAAEDLWRQSLSKGMPFTDERRLKRSSDNTYRWHLSRTVPVKDAQGKVTRWFGTSTDIDDYKRAQAEIQLLNADLKRRVEELADKELHYRLLFEGVKDYALFMLDVSGNVKSWNSGAEQLMGYRTAEVLGAHFSLFHLPAAVSTGEPESSLGYAATNGRFYEEGWRRRKDGSKFWASAVITSLADSAGRLVGFCKIIRDMTEQRKAMSLLVAERQRAELANQAKSTFLAAMSHEIRTPLNSILGMADLLSETELDSAQREYVGRFQRAGANLLALINDILDLSRIESGQFELEEVAFDIEEVAHRALDLISQKTQKNRVNLAFGLTPGMELNYIGDPNRLQQILVNLLGNAAKFTLAGNIVLNIRPHPQNQPNHLCVEVSDTGIGIAKDKLASIFNDFTQAESSTTRRFGGTGLGLGIAERLVKCMGGSLTVQSEIGLGSTFAFDIVLKPAPVSSRGVVPEEKLRGVKILAVDSNQINRAIYEDVFAAWGMQAVTMSSAAGALALLVREARGGNPFSIVLLDRFSEDLDALEALKEIRKADAGIPVLVTMTEDKPGESLRLLSAGFAGCETKPFRRRRFHDLLLKALRIESVAAVLRTLGSPEQKSIGGGQKIRLLVADDSEDNQFLIAAYLKNSPYQPEFTDNGSLALKLFQEKAFDVVLMDVQMPIMDGLQATAAIRALEKAVNVQPVPIIALTANAMADDIEKSRSAGCSAHLAKPISKAHLLRALDTWRPPVKEAAEDTAEDTPASLEVSAPLQG